MKFSFLFPRWAALGLFLIAATLTAKMAKADLIELTNGDHYRGTVLGMTLTNIDFQSEIQGRVKLPRDKVAQITLNETVKPAAAYKPAATNTAQTVLPPLILSGPTASANPAVNPATAAPVPANAANANPENAQAIQQLRQGVDPKLVEQIQQQIFGKGASPEATQKFSELMGGLSSGNLSAQDIRAMAQNSINQIKSAKKDLGGDAGEMLDGYLGILEKFVQETSADGK